MIFGTLENLWRQFKDHTHNGLDSKLVGGSGSMADRGTAADYDFDHTDLTLDNTANEYDLSTVLPSGTTWVLLGVRYKGNTVEAYGKFMSTAYDSTNARRFYLMLNDSYDWDDIWIPVNSGKIGYKIPNTITAMYCVVRAYI